MGGEQGVCDGVDLLGCEVWVEAGDCFAEHAGDFEGTVFSAEVLVGAPSVDVFFALGAGGDLGTVEGLPAELAEDVEGEAFPFRFVDECHGAVPLLGVSYLFLAYARGNH